MHIYRCFFLNESDHIKAAEIIEVEADAIGDVIDKARVMLQERPQYRAVEIWDGARKLYWGDEPAQSERTENG